MDLARPLKPSTGTSVIGIGKLSDSSFRLKVDTSIVDIGGNHASQTSLVRLAAKGFNDALKKAEAELAKDKNVWQTTVSAIDDTQHIRIPVGFKAGLVKGDKFHIFNEKWNWEGDQCASRLESHYHLSNTPIATAIVWAVEDDVTTLQIVGAPTQSIKLGDTVEIAELWKKKKSDKRSLKKALRLLPSYSKGKVVVNNLGEINVPYYLDYIMAPTLNSSQFWVVPN